MRIAQWGLSVAGLLGLFVQPAACRSFTFTKVLDGMTQRPDGLGAFYITYLRTTPAFDGRWVVFRDPGPRNDDGSHAAIWSFDTSDGSFRKLVDFHMPVPGGTGNFHDLELMESAPVARNGVVVFVARDEAARQGLYSVPASGGLVVKIAAAGDPDPTGGAFTLFDGAGKQMGGLSFDGATVAFTGTNNGMAPGIYSATADGSAPALVADSLHPYNTVNGFYAPAVSANRVVMIGTDSVMNGYAGLYMIVPGSGAVSELVNSGLRLPGDTNASFHTRFDRPVLGFDGRLAAFHATDSNSGTPSDPAGLYGLYALDVDSGTVDVIADANSSLPGLGALRAIASTGVAVNSGTVLFQAADASGATALYIWRAGAIERVVGRGDVLDGRVVQGVADTGPSALAGTACAFVVDFRSDRAIYVARESLVTVSGASYTLGSAVAPGSIVSGFGEALAASTDWAAGLPLPTTLAGTTVTVTDSAGVSRPAQLFYIIPAQIGYVIPEGSATGPAKLMLASGGLTVTGVISIQPVAPGLFAANADGRGAPAGLVVSVAPDLTQTWQPLAQCGTLQGSCVPAAIDLGPAGTETVLVLYGTGIRGRSSLAAVTATIGGVAATVDYAGPQPEYVGLDQVNVRIPQALAGAGQVELRINVDGKPANPLLVHIR